MIAHIILQTIFVASCIAGISFGQTEHVRAHYLRESLTVQAASSSIIEHPWRIT
jgi:hypothetical protein